MAPDEEYIVDVTAFIEKMVLSELYGKDQNMLTKERKEEIMSNFKKNVKKIMSHAPFIFFALIL